MPPEPLVLAFDTSAAHCAAAVVSGDRLVAEALDPMEKGQAEHLFPMLERLLSAAGIGWPDLTSLSVGIGPGNFTGVRLSVAAARGLALALKLPLHGVSRLEATALGLPRPCLVALDARLGRAYLQRFDNAECLPEIAALDTVGPDAAVGLACVTGDAAAAILAERLGLPLVSPPLPLARAMAMIAARRPAPVTRPAPLYLLPADAAPPREAPPVILP